MYKRQGYIMSRRQGPASTLISHDFVQRNGISTRTPCEQKRQLIYTWYIILSIYIEGIPWDAISTPGPYPAGLSCPGIKRYYLYGIWPPRDYTGRELAINGLNGICFTRYSHDGIPRFLLVRDPATALLPGTGSSHDGTKRDYLGVIRRPR